MTATADLQADHALGQGFRLGELLVAPQDGEVSGPGGREQLDPKVMGVFLLLAEHAGHVVTREDLLSRLWANAVVTDDVLSRCIYELRRQLSQAGGDEQLKALIETVPKRGYRLTGEVTPLPPQPVTRSRRPAARIALIGAVLAAAGVIVWIAVGRDTTGSGADPGYSSALAEPSSIAVLPFVDMSEGHDHGYLADGIAEEILNRLAQSKDLRVISRTSSFAFRGRQLDVREIAAKLDVDHVLEGSVRRSGDRIRITAQLIAAADNAHVWSETLEREFGSTFKVQDEIAASVATALHVTLRGSGACCPPPASPEALDQFLRGQYFYTRRSPGDIDRAIDNFKQAVAIDPRYATAWAALAGAYGLLIHEYVRPVEELRPLQRDAAHKAVELAPGLAIAHARLGQYYYNIGDDANGDRHFDIAAALDPNDLFVMGHFADRAFWRGDVDEAVAIWRRIVERNPLSPTHRFNLANFLFAAGKPTESAAEFRKSLELNSDFHGTTRLEFTAVLVTLRRYDEAHAQVLKLAEGVPRDHGLALLYQAPGHEADADAALARLAARPVEPGNTLLGELYAFRGMKDEAIAALIDARDALRKSRDSPEHTRIRLHSMQEDMLRSPHLKALHDDPRWAELTADPE